MKRKIITIDKEKCNGCGLCIRACHEEALQLVDGKARLISASYCDGLGSCLPECPTGAISIEEQDVPVFDEEAVKQRVALKNKRCDIVDGRTPSQLMQWPCQIKLVQIDAPFFAQAHLLIAADCTAFAYANIHSDFMVGKVTLIGCPKLDDINYAEKLAAILSHNNIKSLTVLRMSVPCCGGLVQAVKNAFALNSKIIPWKVITVSPDGKIVNSIVQ